MIRSGDPGYGPVCPSCGGPKAPQARGCMACRRASARPQAERWQAWYPANRERLAEKQRQQLQDPERREASLARLREWKAAHPDRLNDAVRAHKRRRRGMSPLDGEYAEIVRRDPCAYCGVPANHADHIQPISRGGDPSWRNLTGACASCNFAKSAQSLLSFLGGRTHDR